MPQQDGRYREPARPLHRRHHHFVAGPKTSNAIQIDHATALGNAWATGAQKWTKAKRVALANDPLNLLAVDGHNNMSKGDGDAATWLPPNKTFRCRYVAIQVAVKHKYGLWVTAAEKAAFIRVLSKCATMRLPQEPGGRG